MTTLTNYERTLARMKSEEIAESELSAGWIASLICTESSSCWRNRSKFRASASKDEALRYIYRWLESDAEICGGEVEMAGAVVEIEESGKCRLNDYMIGLEQF